MSTSSSLGVGELFPFVIIYDLFLPVWRTCSLYTWLMSIYAPLHSSCCQDDVVKNIFSWKLKSYWSWIDTHTVKASFSKAFHCYSGGDTEKFWVCRMVWEDKALSVSCVGVVVVVKFLCLQAVPMVPGTALSLVWVESAFELSITRPSSHMDAYRVPAVPFVPGTASTMLCLGCWALLLQPSACGHAGAEVVHVLNTCSGCLH